MKTEKETLKEIDFDQPILWLLYRMALNFINFAKKTN